MYTPVGFKYEDQSLFTFTLTVNGTSSFIIKAAWQTWTMSHMIQRTELIMILYYTLLHFRWLLTKSHSNDYSILILTAGF